MTPAETALDQAKTGPTDVLTGAMSHEAYYKLAGEVLPGAGLGGYSLPEDVRFVIHRGEGSRLQDVRGRYMSEGVYVNVRQDPRLPLGASRGEIDLA